MDWFEKIISHSKKRPVQGIKGRPRVGIINVWYNRGTSYQSLFMAEVLREYYDVYLFIYKENSLPFPAWLEGKVTYHEHDDPKYVNKWIKAMDLDIVFSPGRDERGAVLDFAKKAGVQYITVQNFEEIEPRFLPHYRKYTGILCPVQCTYDALKGMGLENLHLIRWAIDTFLYSPSEEPRQGPVKFLHNAGWGGAKWRKNSLAVLRAFKIAAEKNGEISLLFKTQKPLKEYPIEVRELVQNTPRVMLNEQDVPFEKLLALYRSCDVSLLPSKWEGIGLPFLESLSMGLPVLTVDAPPMNEWVKNDVTGYNCRVSGWEDRNDLDVIVHGALVDTNEYAKQMLRFSDRAFLLPIRQNCIDQAGKLETQFRVGLNEFTQKLLEKRM